MPKRVMNKGKILFAVIMMTAMLGVLAGCGEQSIAGHWVLQEQQWGEGYFATREYYEDRGIYEEYYLDESGGTYYYTTPDEDFSLEFSYSYDKKGHFWFSDCEEFYHAVTLHGDTFTYDVGEGDDTITYVFERVDD